MSEDPMVSKEESPLKKVLLELDSITGECQDTVRDLASQFQFIMEPVKNKEDSKVASEDQSRENIVGVIASVIKETRKTIDILRDTLDRSLI